MSYSQNLFFLPSKLRTAKHFPANVNPKTWDETDEAFVLTFCDVDFIVRIRPLSMDNDPPEDLMEIPDAALTLICRERDDIVNPLSSELILGV